MGSIILIQHQNIFLLMISGNNRQSIVYLILTIVLINLILNWVYGEHLYRLGNDVIVKMQQFRHPVLDTIMTFFTFMVDPVLVIGCSTLFLIIYKRKREGYITVVFILFNTYLMAIFKSFYAAPRPYWSSSQVQNIGYYCPKQYGNPSGHSWFVVIMGLMLSFQFLNAAKNKLVLAGSIITISMVALSRMYLGAHSLNQIVQGLYLGGCIVNLYYWGGFKQTIKSILENPKKKSSVKMFVICLYCINLLSYFINDLLQQERKQNVNIWAQQIRQKCNGREIDANYLNYIMLFINSILVSIMAGLVFGYNDKKLLKDGENSMRLKCFLEGKWRIKEGPFRFSGFLLYLLYSGILLVTGLSVSPLLYIFSNIYLKIIFTSAAIFLSSYEYARSQQHYLFKKGIIEVIEDEEIKSQ